MSSAKRDQRSATRTETFTKVTKLVVLELTEAEADELYLLLSVYGACSPATTDIYNTLGRVLRT